MLKVFVFTDHYDTFPEELFEALIKDPFWKELFKGEDRFSAHNMLTPEARCREDLQDLAREIDPKAQSIHYDIVVVPDEDIGPDQIQIERDDEYCFETVEEKHRSWPTHKYSEAKILKQGKRSGS